MSTDGGKTWDETGPSEIRHPITRFFLRRLKSGPLILVRHNPPGQLTRSHLTAYVSDDDGRIYIIYDRGRTDAREILLAVFTEADVRQGKCAFSECRLRVLVNKAGD